MSEGHTTIYDLVRAIKGKSAGLPQTLEIDNKIYRGEEVHEEVVKHFNKLGEENNEIYRNGFWNLYEQQCREVLEKVTNHPEIKQARLQEITLQELQQTIDSFPNGKAPDHDGVSHDLLKIMNEQNLKHLLVIMNSIIKNDNFSLPELLKSRFSLLHKGHGKDPLQIKNYRRITVSQTIQRLFDKILNERGYVQKVTDILEASQYGFLKGRSYEMPLLAVRIAISIAMERGLDLIIASFDARTFYPSCSPTIIMRERM